MRNFVLTSTSVTDGHPDKLCDRISDAILDAYLTQDPDAWVNAECALASGIAFVAADATTSARLDLPAIVRAIVEETGYDNPEIEPDAMTVLSSATHPPRPPEPQRPPVDAVSRVNATLFGFACLHTEEMMPLPLAAAHRLVRQIRDLRAGDGEPLFHPDAQAQVAVRHENRQPVSIEGITLSATLRPGLSGPRDAEEAIRDEALTPVLTELDLPVAPGAEIEINPVGLMPRGPAQHAGLTGRKNDIDTYGGYCRHGGAALSGKDPGRADRIGAYAARYAARNIVAAGLAQECEIQISYAIGKARPLCVEIDTFGSGIAPDEEIRRALEQEIDFSIGAICAKFNLGKIPGQRKGRFFADLGAYGHVGRSDLDLPWERSDLSSRLKGHF